MERSGGFALTSPQAATWLATAERCCMESELICPSLTPPDSRRGTGQDLSNPVDSAKITLQRRLQLPLSGSGSRLLAGLEHTELPIEPVTIEEKTVQPRVVVVRGEQLGIAYNLTDGKNYIGRTADQAVDIDLDGQEPVEQIWTSRRHALITRDEYHFILEDLNSLNGTFVNRKRLHPGHKHQLQPGDIIQVGTVQLRYQV